MIMYSNPKRRAHVSVETRQRVLGSMRSMMWQVRRTIDVRDASLVSEQQRRFDNVITQ